MGWGMEGNNLISQVHPGYIWDTSLPEYPFVLHIPEPQVFLAATCVKRLCGNDLDEILDSVSLGRDKTKMTCVPM